MNQTTIQHVIDGAAEKINPQKIILFGSHAYGQPNINSDVDLLFVINTPLSGLKRYCWVSDNIEHKFPMDILVKTPAEIKKRIKMGDPFYKEIINKGKVLYESAK